MRDNRDNNLSYELKIRKQLLDLMMASKELIDAKNLKKDEKTINEAIEKMNSEYAKAAILIKSRSRENVAALLRPRETSSLLDPQMFSFRESLSVGLEESN
jgi:hypothetical protein